MDGYILMVDLARGEDALGEAAGILQHFREMSDAPFVVGANRAAGHPELRQRLDEILRLDDAATVIPCEATDKESAKEVLLALLIKVLSGLADDAEIPVG
jgi:signal recognition particle receptor subunit beta